MGSHARRLKRHQDRDRKKEAMTGQDAHPHPHDEQPVQQDEANQPDKDDIISTLLEEIRDLGAQVTNANDQRMFFKALTKKLQRRAEAAEMGLLSKQARIDELEAEIKGEDVPEEDVPPAADATLVEAVVAEPVEEDVAVA